MVGQSNISLWINPKEWLQVFSYLFDQNSNNNSRAKALNHIRCWKFRAELPLAVELTFNLFDIALHDPAMEYKFPKDRQFHDMKFDEIQSQHYHSSYHDIFSQFSDSHLSMMYGMSIVRLVNGFVDSQQTKVYAQSIVKLAEKVNIPRWFVELRHEVTHDKLPHLDSLRLAASEAILWLYDFYWKPQYDQWTNIKSQMNSLLDAYVSTASKSSNIHVLKQMIDSFLNIFESLKTCFYMQRIWFWMLIEKINSDSAPFQPYWMWVEIFSTNYMFIVQYASLLFDNKCIPSKVFWDILDKLVDRYLASDNFMLWDIIEALVKECKRHPNHSYAIKCLNKIKRICRMIGRFKENNNEEQIVETKGIIDLVKNWTPCPLGHLSDQWNSELLLK